MWASWLCFDPGFRHERAKDGHGAGGHGRGREGRADQAGVRDAGERAMFVCCVFVAVCDAHMSSGKQDAERRDSVGNQARRNSQEGGAQTGDRRA